MTESVTESRACWQGENPEATAGLEIVPFSSGYRVQTYLACLPSGRVLEISGVLREMLLLMDGSRCPEEIAECLTAAGGPRQVEASDVRQVIDRRFYPNGLLEAAQARQASSSSQPLPKPRTQGIQLCPARLLVPLTRQLRILFCSPVVIASLALIALCLAATLYLSWLSADRLWPERLSPLESGILYGLLLGSVLFHELGHLSACSFHGCGHGELRLGLYLIFPVFYSNVTRAWTLPRRARVAVDLGGIYFQMLLLIPGLAAYWVTESPLWICFCIGLVSMAAFALNPFFRFDGYWLCSDLLGVPNLRARSRMHLKQTLLRVLGRSDSRSVRFDLRGPEGTGLLLYGVLSHLFFILSVAFLLYFLSGRVGGLLPLPWASQAEVFREFRVADPGSRARILLHVVAWCMLAVAACRMAWRGLWEIARILCRVSFAPGSGQDQGNREKEKLRDEAQKDAQEGHMLSSGLGSRGRLRH